MGAILSVRLRSKHRGGAEAFSSRNGTRGGYFDDVDCGMESAAAPAGTGICSDNLNKSQGGVSLKSYISG